MRWTSAKQPGCLVVLYQRACCLLWSTLFRCDEQRTELKSGAQCSFDHDRTPSTMAMAALYCFSRHCSIVVLRLLATWLWWR